MADLAVVDRTARRRRRVHSRLLRTTVLRDLAEQFPGRFNNKTNGVTPRRWLLLANPDLARLITDVIGEDWVGDLTLLEKLLPLAEDASFRDAFRLARRTAKVRFAGWLAMRPAR